jgi:hypothetical protein
VLGEDRPHEGGQPAPQTNLSGENVGLERWHERGQVLLAGGQEGGSAGEVVKDARHRHVRAPSDVGVGRLDKALPAVEIDGGTDDPLARGGLRCVALAAVRLVATLIK